MFRRVTLPKVREGQVTSQDNDCAADRVCEDHRWRTLREPALVRNHLGR